MSRFCTACGTKVDDKSTVCTNCGKPFEKETAQNQMPQPTPMPNYGGMPQPTPMPNYGGMPQSTPMPNYGGMPQSTPAPTPMPGYGNMPQQNTVGVATMPQAEPKTESEAVNNSSNPSAGDMPTPSTMPNNGNAPQNPMPNNGNIPPQNPMPNNAIPTANGVTPGFGAQMPTNASTTKGSNGKIIAVVAIAVGVIVALIVAAILVLPNFSGGYKSVIDTKIKAIEQLDAENLAKTYPVFLYEADYDTFEDFVDDVDSDALEGAETLIEELEAEVGENVKLSYEIDKISDVSEKKFDNFCAGIDYEHDYDTSKIKEIKKADIVITAKGDDDTFEFEWEDVYLIKDKGEWYILNMDLEFGNIEGADSIWHSDFYDYYKEVAPEEADEDSDDEDSLY